MGNPAQSFIEDIIALSPTLAFAHRQTIDYWLPEAPPVTVAYAEIGHSLVDNFHLIEPEVSRAIFDMIESGQQEADEELRTALATGLIEGMVGRATKQGVWERVRDHLGPISKRHADAWATG